MEAVQQESEFVKHLPCTNPDCNSSDGNSLYSDGHTYCFVCNTYNNGTNNDGVSVNKVAPLFNFVEGTHQSLSSRKITLESCEKWNYTVGTYGSEVVQVANYYNKNRQVCFQKIRFKNNRHLEFLKLLIRYLQQ